MANNELKGTMIDESDKQNTNSNLVTRSSLQQSDSINEDDDLNNERQTMLLKEFIRAQKRRKSTRSRSMVQDTSMAARFAIKFVEAELIHKPIEVKHATKKISSNLEYDD